ncbi:MAG TPA: hypothetical protein VKF81_14420 [Blastocatellia bacterium]|nr:hypothetical protein [Blastocatellia bacterium]
MASYRITFKPSAEKDLRSLPKTMIARVFKRIEALKDNLFHGNRLNSKAQKVCSGLGSATIARFTMSTTTSGKSSSINCDTGAMHIVDSEAYDNNGKTDHFPQG